MKKGFTLIELLAVIVILAIIALIATPIVLSIINDTKESATLRSADFYLDGVELSVSTATLKDGAIPDGQYPIMEDGNLCIGDLTDNTCTGDILEVEVKGEKPSNGVITIESGQISDILLYSGNKTVAKNDEGELTSVTQVYKPQYYIWTEESVKVGDVLLEGTKENGLEIGYLAYLGFDVELDENDNKIVTTSYTCFVVNGTEHCIKANDYKISQAIIANAFKNEADASCRTYNTLWGCSTDSVYADISTTGKTDIADTSGSDWPRCLVYSDYSASCHMK
jgi:type IV pilus assembly protein PilA